MHVGARSVRPLASAGQDSDSHQNYLRNRIRGIVGGGAGVGNGYMTINNTGNAPDRFIGGSTDIARYFEATK